MTGAALEAVSVAWNGAAPDWVKVLAAECERAASQRRVGELIGYSAAVINQVLRNRYAGDLNKVAEKVRGRFMGKTVDCPVLEQIPRDACLAHQAVKLADLGANPARARVWRACRGGCAHSLLPKGARP